MLFEDMVKKSNSVNPVPELNEENISPETDTNTVQKTQLERMNEVNPDTGLPYNIPMLSPGNPDYNYLYADIMRLKDESPETFNLLMKWE
jgi:hypothetical protein